MLCSLVTGWPRSRARCRLQVTGLLRAARISTSTLLSGPIPEVRDYGDKLVMPGIIDSHTHYAQGAFVSDPDFAVNLIDCTSFEQCMERVQAFAEDHPNNEWIVGYQVIQFQWDVPEDAYGSNDR